MYAIRRPRSDQRFAWAAAGWIVLLLAPLAPSSLLAQAAEPNAPDLSAVRTALEKYKDPYVAIRDGYF